MEKEGGGSPAGPGSPDARFSREFMFFPRRQNISGSFGHVSTSARSQGGPKLANYMPK